MTSGCDFCWHAKICLFARSRNNGNDVDVEVMWPSLKALGKMKFGPEYGA